MCDHKEYSGADIKVVEVDDSIYESVDLSRNAFCKNLQDAAILARDFTRTMVTNHLPDPLMFIIYFGRSFDTNTLRGDEKTFPDDDQRGPIQASSLESVASHVWRYGFVPEWINVTVSHESITHTHISLQCCGRFSTTPKLMYHVQEGWPPFHVLGPALPPEYDRKTRTRFDLHWQNDR